MADNPDVGAPYCVLPARGDPLHVDSLRRHVTSSDSETLKSAADRFCEDVTQMAVPRRRVAAVYPHQRPLYLQRETEAEAAVRGAVQERYVFLLNRVCKPACYAGRTQALMFFFQAVRTVGQVGAVGL